MIGEVGGQFRYDRRSLLESVSHRAKEEVERYDPEQHAQELSLGVRSAVAQVAVAEAGAVGLGALVVAAASTVAVDVTGILAASLVAGLGLFILPRKRKQSRAEFRRRSDELEAAADCGHERAVRARAGPLGRPDRGRDRALHPLRARSAGASSPGSRRT